MYVSTYIHIQILNKIVWVLSSCVSEKKWLQIDESA